MALNQSSEVIQDWTAVAQNAVGESATIDVSGNYSTTLQIQAFLDTETAHTGTEFIIQIARTSSGDEDWQDFTRFVGLVGTANQEPLTNNPAAAGTTVLTCASTTGYAVADVPLPWIGIKDATLANSELGLLVAISANTSITLLDGTTNSHAQNTNMYNIAMTQPVNIPMGTALRARMVINNCYDVNGSTAVWKVNATKTTSI